MSTVGLKELRQNLEKYAREVQKGRSYLVMRHSKPLFVIGPVNEGRWEMVIDFTKLKKGGIDIDDLLSRV